MNYHDQTHSTLRGELKAHFYNIYIAYTFDVAERAQCSHLTPAHFSFAKDISSKAISKYTEQYNSESISAQVGIWFCNMALFTILTCMPLCCNSCKGVRSGLVLRVIRNQLRGFCLSPQHL